jgi:hypothetical protein
MNTARITANFSLLFLSISAQIMLLPQQALNQTKDARAAVGHGRSIPPDHLYWHFLEYQLYLDRTAAGQESEGQNPEINKHYQTKLGFSDSQFAIVRQVATKLDSDLKGLDSQARPIIDQFRKDYPPGKVLSPPPVPTRLVELQQQREIIISSAAESLKKRLGALPTAKMDDMLNKEFAPRVTFQSLTVPMPKRPLTAAPDDSTNGVTNTGAK